jgi:hypothetical protein
MTDAARLLVAVVAIVLIVGLIGYARGTAHHRGTEIGEHPAHAPSLRVK